MEAPPLEEPEADTVVDAPIEAPAVEEEAAPAAEADAACRRGARRRRVTAPPFVGLTGGIGAGKSEALAALERLGAATISSDQVVHELYDDPEVRAAVVARWGERRGARRTRGPGGGRPPRVRRPTRTATGSSACCGRAWARGSPSGATPQSRRDPAPRALVVETPLLFEAGLEGNYDATIAVVADEAVRAERARRPRPRGARRAHRPPAHTGRKGRAGDLRCRELRQFARISSRSCRGFLRS